MPAPILAVTGVTSTVANVAVANTAADGTMDVQYGIRPDFELCVCPLVRGVARGNIALGQLNAGTTYYVRVRSRRANGDVEDWSNVVAARTAPGAPRDLSPAAVMIEPAIVVVPCPILSWPGVSAPIAGYPISNLGHDGPTSAAIDVTATGTASFFVEIGGDPVDTIALLQTNAPEASTIAVDAGDTLDVNKYSYGPIPFRASPALPGRPGYHSLMRLPAAQSYRYWHIRVTAPVFGGHFEAQQLVLGLNRATKNHSVDKAESVVDYGTLERTRAGNPVRTLGARHRRVDFDISMLTEAQFEANYADLDWRVGQTEPLLVVPNSKAGSFLHDRILYGPMRGGKIVNPASPRYTRGFTIESII